MNILSLFDGMSCGQIALNKLNLNYSNYYASEVDLKAIRVTMDNYPDTKQIGDVRDVKSNLLPNIDLMLGGSPCQSFSFAGTKEGMVTEDKIEITTLEQYLELKNNNFKFKGQSYLFWEYVRLLNDIKPKYFLLENVMMNKKWRKVIDNTLGVEAIQINSNHFSIQNRKRLYWTNIPIDKYEDKGLLFKDHYSKEYDENLILKGRGLNKLKRDRCRVYDINSDKLPTIMKEQESKPTDAIVIKHGEIYRYPTREEAELMQTVPINYTKSVKYNDAMGMLGNGWTVDVIKHILKNIKS